MSSPDWEQLERDYRAGSLSVRAIAERYNVSHTAIQKRAKKFDWKQDLSEQVKTSVKAKVARSVATKSCQNDMATNAEIVEKASNEIAAVVMSHRVSIDRWRNISDKLASALDDIEITETNHRSVSASINAGVDALGKVIKMERQAFGLDDEKPDNTINDLADLMKELSDEA